jgi:hypothetical protein
VIAFTSENIEKLPVGWRARETYKLIDAEEFIEIFELAESALLSFAQKVDF